MNDRLVLNKFKRAYSGISKGLPKWLKHLLLGYMVWLEDKYITAKAKAAVSKAVREYEEEEVVEPNPLDGVRISEFHIRARFKSSEYFDENL